MGNEHCCDDRDKAGDFNGPVQKVNNKQLQRIGTQDVEQSFDKPGTKKTMASSKDIKVDPNISTSFLKMIDQPDPEDNWRIQPKKTENKNPITDKEGNLSFSNSDNGNSSFLKVLPEMNEHVRKTFEEEKFFANIATKGEIRQYGEQMYEGEVSNNIPNGFGKFYKKDGSIYIGYFSYGQAHGEGAFIFPDGSYYKGTFQENKADNSGGLFKSKDLTYQGGFKNNIFHGKGQEKGPNHEFKGEYSNGNKASGSLIWRQDNEQFIYEGTFNEQGQFHGRGNLREPTGQYEGQFQNGAKHGHGSYKYTNLLIYEGQYYYNERSGNGKLLNPNGRIAYEGHFEKGLPHGEGIVHDKEGQPHNSVWIMGIDQDVL